LAVVGVVVVGEVVVGVVVVGVVVVGVVVVGVVVVGLVVVGLVVVGLVGVGLVGVVGAVGVVGFVGVVVGAGPSETKMTTVEPYGLEVSGGGSVRVTVPAGASDVDRAGMTVKCAFFKVAVAAAWLWPMTLGTLM